MAIYTILYESDYDVTNGHSSYEAICHGMNEAAIFKFYNSSENRKKYPDMFIERYHNKCTNRWDDELQTWT